MNPHSHIVLAHGGGGQLTEQLIATLILPRLGNAALQPLLDSALLPAPPAGHRLAFTTDAYVVQPWRFPGGDIGRLAICGTVNDLAVCGAKPLGISLSLILAEGLALADLEAVLDSVAAAAKEAGVSVVTGDTKVVGHNQADGLYITTAGLGAVPDNCRLAPQRVAPGDVVLINGPIGDHGLAVLLTRQMPQMRTNIRSDAAPLNGLIAELLEATGGPDDSDGVVFMRDATRGGLAGVAADLAAACGHRVVLEEVSIAVRPETQHAADMLGLDPLEIANEGKVVVVVRPAQAPAALAALRRHPLGQRAQAIGIVNAQRDGLCILTTRLGGQRILQKPYGEMLPRIC